MGLILEGVCLSGQLLANLWFEVKNLISIKREESEQIPKAILASDWAFPSTLMIKKESTFKRNDGLSLKILKYLKKKIKRCLNNLEENWIDG